MDISDTPDMDIYVLNQLKNDSYCSPLYDIVRPTKKHAQKAASWFKLGVL